MTLTWELQKKNACPNKCHEIIKKKLKQSMYYATLTGSNDLQ